MIYRGYDINETGDGHEISIAGKVVHTCPTEDAAFAWIDAEKRAQAKAVSAKMRHEP